MNTKEKILQIGLDDWLYLAMVESVVHEDMPDLDDDELRETTIQIVQDLALSGLIEIGDLTGEGGRFVKWQISIPQAIDRIRREWLLLDQPISIGDVCWLSNTTEGDRRTSAISPKSP